MTDLKKLHNLLKNKILGLEQRLAETDKKLSDLRSNGSDCSLGDTPFRNVMFRYKNTPVISHYLLDKVKGTAVCFKDLCAVLVKYIISSRSSVDKLGNIKCDSVLKRIFDCDSPISFFQLIQKIGRIID